MRVLADKNTSLSKRILKQQTAIATMTELIRSDREERRTIFGALSTELNQSLQKNARQRVVLATLSRSEPKLGRRKIRNHAAESNLRDPDDPLAHVRLRDRLVSVAMAGSRCRHGCGLSTCPLNGLGLTDQDLDKVHRSKRTR